MTGGWGKSYVALLIGAAALTTVNKAADAQGVSATPATQTTTTQRTTSTAQRVAPYTLGTRTATQQSVANTIRATTGAPLRYGQFGPAQLATPQLRGTTPDLVVTGRVRGTVDLDDNGSLLNSSPGTDARYRLSFGLDVISTTPISNLDFSIGADLQYEDLAAGRSENGLENPYVQFGYIRNGPDNQLDAALSYRTDDIIDSIFIDTDGDLIDDTLLTSTGRVERFTYGLNYSFGLLAPFGMDFAFGRAERRYIDTLNPNLFDRVTNTAGVVARFRINPVATARLILNTSLYEASNTQQTERDTTNYGFGFQWDIRPDLRFDGQLTRTDIKEELTLFGNRVRFDNDGLSGQLAMIRDLNNGTFTIAARRIQSTLTARDDIAFNRTMDVPAGTLAFSLGISGSDTGDTVWVGSLDYFNQRPNGAFTANLSRNATVNLDNEEVLRTIFGLGYTHILTPTASVLVRINAADVENIGVGNISPSTRADFNIGYSHQLTRDWDWTVGYRHRYRRNQTTGSSQNSNAFLFGIGRSISIRPR